MAGGEPEVVGDYLRTRRGREFGVVIGDHVRARRRWASGSGWQATSGPSLRWSVTDSVPGRAERSERPAPRARSRRAPLGRAAQPAFETRALAAARDRAASAVAASPSGR